jgi:putative ABC transport system permease protein
MELGPILSAMRRNKVGAVLIALQMTVTLAILCNAIFIVQQRLAAMSRPSGVDEAVLFTIDNGWIGDPKDTAARLRMDLDALRALPGVVDAYASESFPFSHSSWSDGFTLHPEHMEAATAGAVYFGDEHTLHTLGTHLVAGRDLTAGDVVDYHGLVDQPVTSGVIVSRAMAQKLASDGQVLGKIVTMIPTGQTAPIVGVIDRLQAPWVGTTGLSGMFGESTMILPYRYVSPRGSYYVVRTQPGQVSAVMKAAETKLYAISGARVINKIQSLADARHEAYRGDRGLAVMLTVVCVVLVAVTAFGIIGLTSYWVAQRRRQIGVRRALGATRLAIVRYFQSENLLIAAAGSALGVALAIAANLWMVGSLEMSRLPIAYVVTGAVVTLLLGQLAVLYPALRAASIPPAIATRAA